ncbi:MAG: type IX secretion system outer membrane channel protein PorV [Candidatus Pseudobacter hemicellulosilyticus]|uniref:Type IX secretion system outer membrane channel protein PorV n=1 Tax=Candidatus Pseudobacter hemicellulosilyticus TaxID=3121375 RepID=A0AAJ5WNF1_9BACT|nr:MAG: type IX secretion system outer membrane channel protein PorV [Pseudobacter sp.]
MRSIIKKAITMTPVLLGFAAAGQAQTERVNIVTTAVPFLRITPDARAGGMGEAAIAASPDASSQFYNVAKYPFMESKSGISATYTPWLRKLGLNDVYLASLAGYYKLDDEQAFSGSLRYFNLGNIQITDYNGNDLNAESPREMCLDLGYSRKLSDHLALGLSVRYIRSTLARSAANGTAYKSGNAVAADLGLYYTTVNDKAGGWSAGLALSNIGSKIGYTSDASQKSFLPANIGLGAGYTWITDEVNKISVTGEINKLLVPVAPIDGTEEDYRKYNERGLISSITNSFDNKAMAYSLGAEYVYDGQFAIRAGYYTDSRSIGKRNYFTTGLGVNYNMLGINFSYLIPSGNGANVNPLSNTLRFSLLVDLGQVIK